ncbi:MAG: HD domain-containing protein [Candidatus Pacebacteria bacterium]|nr:HD domain-containing protein [Candidatus Paceibacterota bacterium]
MNLIQKAILTAMKAHEGQVRKGDGQTPYILHPLEAGIILSNYTTNEDLVSIAILHDVIEDGNINYEEIKDSFSEEIADAVNLLSEDKSIKDWQERKTENLARLSSNMAIYIIKAVDALVNMKDLFYAIETYGEGVWERFNASKEMKMQYFERILKDTKASLPIDLLEKYVSTLKDLQYSHLLPKQNKIGFIE